MKISRYFDLTVFIVLASCQTILPSGIYRGTDNLVVTITQKGPVDFTMHDNRGRCALFWRAENLNFIGVDCGTPVRKDNNWSAIYLDQNGYNIKFTRSDGISFTVNKKMD